MGVMNTDRYSSEHTEGTLVEPGGVLRDGRLAGSSSEANDRAVFLVVSGRPSLCMIFNYLIIGAIANPNFNSCFLY